MRDQDTYALQRTKEEVEGLVAGEEVRAILCGKHGQHATRAAQELKPAIGLVVPDIRVGAAAPHGCSHYREFDAAA